MMLVLPMSKNSPDVVCEIDGQEILRIRVITYSQRRVNGRRRSVKRLAFICPDNVRIRREYKGE